jgi:uncharacterized protein YacL
MALKMIRAIFVVACCIMGGLWMLTLVGGGWWVIVGALLGAGLSIGVLLLLRFITQEVFERLAPAFGAIVVAMLVGYVVGEYVVYMADVGDILIRTYTTTTLVLLFGFVGISLGLTRASNWEALIKAIRKRHFETESLKIIDTSVIIDGRLVDLCKTGFLEGTLIIPRFVLRELQNIADSPDAMRRARGRRGLDILKALQEDKDRLPFEVLEEDPVHIREVDGKLIWLARHYRAKIVTNDLNLNKVARIEGVEVLNVNDLANALKPAVMPDEPMHVRIIKEGKEVSQGVGYLDDGTMIVVDGGKDHVGKDVSVVVTSVLQTSAGRMIFAKLGHVLP